MSNVSVFGDILAIPMFFISFIYFYKIKNRKPIEDLLLLFSLSGLITDIYFTYLSINKFNDK